MTQQRSNDDVREDLRRAASTATGFVHDAAIRLAGDFESLRARAERAEAQRDKALVLLADAIPDPKGAMDSPQWHRRMDALAAGLSLQEEQPTHLVGAGGWRACDTAADWAGSDTTGVTCAECLATTTDVLQEEQE